MLDMVPEKLGIPSSEFIWIRGKGPKITLSLTSYIGGEIDLVGKGEWPVEGNFYIDRRTLFPFVYAAKEIKDKHTFQFERKKKELLVSHGKRKTVLTSQSNVQGYGSLKKILKHHEVSSFPSSDVLRELLLCGKNCAQSHTIEPKLDCVYVSKGSGGSVGIEAFASSDKVYYLGKGKLDKGSIKKSIPFPLYLIDLLNMKELQTISWRGSYIILTLTNGIIWQPISDAALKDFPVRGIRSHANRAVKLPITFTASSRRFSRIMLRMSGYLQGVRREDWVVGISGKRKDLSLSVTTNIPGAKFSDKISIPQRLKKDFKMEWPLNMLEPVFDFLSKKTKKLGIMVRIDRKHGISYISAGQFWLAVPARQD